MPKTPKGTRLGGKPKGYKAATTIAREQAEAKVIADAGLTAARVLEEYRRLAFIDTTSFFNEDGTCKRIQDLTPEQGSCLAGFEVLIKNAAAGDGHTDTIHKFRLWDKTRALESLAKHFGLLIERVDLQGEVAFRWLNEEK
jgi:hypothetical protein